MPSIMTRGGAELYVKDWGAGRPLILIHGWPLSADSWDDVSVPLAMAGFRTIAYDRRGFGRSSQPWDGFDYDTLSDDLADVLSALRLSDVTLIGFSMGGGEVASAQLTNFIGCRYRFEVAVRRSAEQVPLFVKA